MATSIHWKWLTSSGNQWPILDHFKPNSMFNKDRSFGLFKIQRSNRCTSLGGWYSDIFYDISPGAWWYKITEVILQDLPGRFHLSFLVTVWLTTWGHYFKESRNHSAAQWRPPNVHICLQGCFEDKNKQDASPIIGWNYGMFHKQIYSICESITCWIFDWNGTWQKVFKLELTQEQSRHVQPMLSFCGDCDDNDDDLTPTMEK